MITDAHKEQLDKLMSRAIDNDHLLSDWENAFVSDFVERLEQYGTSLRVSDKQQAIFDRIDEKLNKAGV